VVKEHLEQQKWEVLSHPPYSPDLAPSDYYLFRSMASGLASQRFQNFAEVQNWVANWIQGQKKEFWWEGIRKLPERWAKVVASDGQYFE
jgi:hypothetical protein